MKIKWYWPMEILGLVKDLTGEYNDGYTHYEVSRRCDELMKILLWGLFPALFLLGFLARRCLARADRTHSARGWYTVARSCCWDTLSCWRRALGRISSFTPRAADFSALMS